MRDDMRGERSGKNGASNALLYYVMLMVAALLAVFAVALQPDLSLFTGFWRIQTGYAGLITDPICTGGAGAALFAPRGGGYM